MKSQQIHKESRGNEGVDSDRREWEREEIRNHFRKRKIGKTKGRVVQGNSREGDLKNRYLRGIRVSWVNRDMGNVKVQKMGRRKAVDRGEDSLDENLRQ